MTENKFVSQLVSELRPIKHSNPFRSFPQVLLISVVLTMCATFLSLGLRSGLNQAIQNPYFLITSFGLALVFIGGTESWVRSCIPGDRMSKFFQFTFFPGIFFVLGTQVASFVWDKSGFLLAAQGVGWTCVVEIISFSVPVSFAMVAVSKKYFISNINLSLSLGIAACLGFGSLLLQFICHNDSPGHVAVWHGLPFVICYVTLLVVIIARRLQRQNQ